MEEQSATPPPGLNGEQLLAVLGIRSFIARQHERVLVGDHTAAREVLEDISEELRAFLSGEEPTKSPGRPAKAQPFLYLKTVEQLAKPIEPADIEAMIGVHRSRSDAVDLLVPLTRAVAYLLGAAPKRSKQGLFSAEPLRPSDQEIHSFARVFEAVDDPMMLLRRLRAGSLLPDEVAAVAACYPALYSEIQIRAGQAFADQLERQPKFKLSYRHEKLLRTLLMAGPQDPGLVADLQAMFGDQQQDQGPPPSRGSNLKLKAESYKTAAQATE